MDSSLVDWKMDHLNFLLSPPRRFHLVKRLNIAIRGDGVNDAPALAQAQIGIAVDGATEAARSAADIILTQPGLLGDGSGKIRYGLAEDIEDDLWLAEG